MSGWDMNDIKEALSEDDHDNGGETAAPAAQPEHRTGPIEAWATPQANDYSEDRANTTWMSSGVVYEWDGEEGDLAPEQPELEVELFGAPEERDPQGINFNKIDSIDVHQEGMERIVPITHFKDAGLHPAMLKNVELAGYKMPTPIQRYCIPAIKMGYDLIAIAQTGSGKTAAYLVPILNHLMGKAKKIAAPRPTGKQLAERTAQPVRAEPLVVVVVPTRELAIQIFNEARKFCYRTMLRPATAYGGAPMSEQIANLQKGCDVLIASPGRLIDIMGRHDVLSLRRVKYMVVDEADEMLEDDWAEAFSKILTGGEQEEGNVKYMLFSATFPTAVRKLAKTHLAETHIRIKVGRVGSTHANIRQDIVYIEYSMKKQALLDLLWSRKPTRTIIFVNSKRQADEVDDYLFNKGLPCTSMHADRTQREREDAMRAFRSGRTPVLIATGISARGIDVRNVMHVINYDLPSMDHGGIQEYIHRIGRTGRIGHQGTATSFYNDRDEPIAELLTMTLMETGQDIPDFLSQYKPEETDVSKLKFEYGSDEEEPFEDGDGAAGGWDNDANASTGGDGDGWGNDGDAAPAENGWGTGGGAAQKTDAGNATGDGWGKSDDDW
ncbi:P-loop containing nucleoside triphosphate hydrolase protein [Xylariaceae sp. FL1019]|nr:P-loop containing nucleoside triphosphate hydrolase protein [Xylariaceae sp. FL1019]